MELKKRETERGQINEIYKTTTIQKLTIFVMEGLDPMPMLLAGSGVNEGVGGMVNEIVGEGWTDYLRRIER